MTLSTLMRLPMMALILFWFLCGGSGRAAVLPWLSPTAIAATPDGSKVFIVCATGERVLVLDTSSRKVTRSIKTPPSPNGLAISPDGATLYVTCAAPESQVCVIDVNVAPERSILVPTAHDEPAIRLGIYADVFARAAGIAFNTESERRFLLSTFRVNAVGQETVGCGVNLPPEPPARRERGEKDAGANGQAAEPDEGRWADEDVTQVGRYRWGPRGSAFRRRHRLREPFVLYGGRIDPGKGCEELFEYFRAYVSGGGEATLALMGAKLMPIPDEQGGR